MRKRDEREKYCKFKWINEWMRGGWMSRKKLLFITFIGDLIALIVAYL